MANRKSGQAKLISRIRDMEDRYDKLNRAIGALEDAISGFEDAKIDLDILREYMDSGQWKKDFEADEAGQIPAEVKRGVLSEDGLYNLLLEADYLLTDGLL